MNDYEQKRAARVERMRARADRLRATSEGTIEQARKRADIIPFGQPILVGHHSEKRDRNYRGKIEAGFKRGFEGLKEADRLEARADAAEDNRMISSDDPDASWPSRMLGQKRMTTRKPWQLDSVVIEPQPGDVVELDRTLAGLTGLAVSVPSDTYFELRDLRMAGRLIVQGGLVNLRGCW